MGISSMNFYSQEQFLCGKCANCLNGRKKASVGRCFKMCLDDYLSFKYRGCRPGEVNVGKVIFAPLVKSNL